jgi:hypothetical protein
MACLVLLSAPLSWAGGNENVTPARATLLMPVDQTSAAFDGARYVYVFGGVDVTNNANGFVTKYDIVNDVVTPTPSVLIQPRTATAAVWDSRSTPACPRGCAYILGGSNFDWSASSEIDRFEPTLGTLTKLPSALPCGNWGHNAFFDGRYAYVVGGVHWGCAEQITRFDPLTGTVSAMNAHLAVKNLTWMSTVWDPRDRLAAGCPNGCAYILGGSAGYMAFFNTILQYNPTTDTLTTTTMRLPQPQDAASAAFDGTRVIVFGGYPNNMPTSRILAIDPVACTVTTSNVQLPTNLTTSSAVWANGHGYVFGGYTDQGRSSTIQKYSP